MEISKSIERKYLHNMAIDQLFDEYSHLGYQVTREPLIGEYHADLMASKDNETIIFEVKTGQMDSELRRRLAAFSAYVNQRPNHRFRVVFATPPQTKTIEVENLEELLVSYLTHQAFPPELVELSSNTLIDNVSDVEITSISVLPTGELSIDATGIIEVTLRLGSSDGVEIPDSYPFDFSALLTHDGREWQIEELPQCRVDVSSFYE